MTERDSNRLVYFKERLKALIPLLFKPYEEDKESVELLIYAIDCQIKEIKDKYNPTNKILYSLKQ